MVLKLAGAKRPLGGLAGNLSGPKKIIKASGSVGASPIKAPAKKSEEKQDEITEKTKPTEEGATETNENQSEGGSQTAESDSKSAKSGK